MLPSALHLRIAFWEGSLRSRMNDFPAAFTALTTNWHNMHHICDCKIHICLKLCHNWNTGSITGIMSKLVPSSLTGLWGFRPVLGRLSTGGNCSSVLSTPHWTENRYIQDEVPILRVWSFSFLPLTQCQIRDIHGFLQLFFSGGTILVLFIFSLQVSNILVLGTLFDCSLEDFFLSWLYTHTHANKIANFTGDETPLSSARHPQQVKSHDNSALDSSVHLQFLEPRTISDIQQMSMEWTNSSHLLIVCWRMKGCVSSCLGTKSHLGSHYHL